MDGTVTLPALPVIITTVITINLKRRGIYSFGNIFEILWWWWRRRRRRRRRRTRRRRKLMTG